MTAHWVEEQREDGVDHGARSYPSYAMVPVCDNRMNCEKRARELKAKQQLESEIRYCSSKIVRLQSELDLVRQKFKQLTGKDFDPPAPAANILR